MKPANYDVAYREAKRRGLPLLVHFSHEERSLSQRMRMETLADPRVVEACAKHYVAVWLDAAKQAELFRTLIGSGGALATCVIEPAMGGGTLGVLPGFAEPAGFQEFLIACVARRGRAVQLTAALRRGRASVSESIELAELFEELGNGRRALQVYEGVLRDAGVELGTDEGCKAAKRPDTALGSATIASATVGSANVHEHLARLLVGQGHTRRARRELERAKSANADLERLLLTRALLLFAERRLNDARVELTRHQRQFPDSADRGLCLFTLARVEHELGNETAALLTVHRLQHEMPEFSVDESVFRGFRHEHGVNGRHLP